MHQVHQRSVRSRPVLGPANRVTLSRAALVILVGALALWSSTPGWLVAAVAAAALALDAVDGWVARRTGTVTRFGARFDMETDAALILVLSAYVAAEVGWWVVLIGLARYVLLGAQHVWPALRGDLPARRWRKLVAALQGIVLVVAASPLPSRPVTVAMLLVAAALLAWSFGTEVLERLEVEVSAAVSALAVALVWVALTAPAGGDALSPMVFLRVPLEGVLLVGLAALLPPRWGARLALLFGLLLAPLLVLKALDVGFSQVVDRTFRPVGDWIYLKYAVDIVADSTGRPVAVLVAVLLACVVLALLVLLPVATMRAASAARRHRAGAATTAAGLGILALLLGASTTTTAALALDELHQVRADLHDRTVFAREIAADPFADVPGDQLLQGLRGKDVLLVFVESYGRSAVEGSSYAAGITRVLADGTRRLRGAGYESRSAYLTSPTFGAGSWLAHATTQSGLWVSSQRRYDQLLGAQRLTLTSAFESAGWRTVFDVPANTLDWPEGADFYGFDELYDSRNVGYRGPEFGYASMPDQFTLAHFHAQELATPDRPPVMAEIDLVSSHHPWMPPPLLVPWAQVGDGSVFAGTPDDAVVTPGLPDRERVRRDYGRSVEYSLATLVSFLTHHADGDLVVVMLGDHQPYRYVSGEEPGYDVPVSVIAKDPAVLARISGWGWTPGLTPDARGPVWRMDRFRDRFLTAFSTGR